MSIEEEAPVEELGPIEDMIAPPLEEEEGEGEEKIDNDKSGLFVPNEEEDADDDIIIESPKPKKRKKRKPKKKKTKKKKKVVKKKTPRRRTANKKLAPEINQNMEYDELEESFGKKELAGFLYDRRLDDNGTKPILINRILDYFDGKLSLTGHKRKRTSFSHMADSILRAEKKIKID